MKQPRLWLLLLLAFLLPVRGALAATMLCMPAVGAVHAESAETGTGHHHEDAASVHAGQALAHDHAQHDHGKGAHDHPKQDKCNVCSSTCSSPPLPSATASIGEPQVLAAVSYPELEAPAPTSRSDGEERPPRTC